ncbi:unnamed protein product [Prorocentrum cordatum]|uniref:Uncharacterized protein n=1 Tax=Prorocentrum cordatum TaxID=2364126 RepID=A0ABN9SM28_9DINO|nr:unnamed protein product [Polarella glacialis]
MAPQLWLNRAAPRRPEVVVKEDGRVDETADLFVGDQEYDDLGFVRPPPGDAVGDRDREYAAWFQAKAERRRQRFEHARRPAAGWAPLSLSTRPGALVSVAEALWHLATEPLTMPPSPLLQRLSTADLQKVRDAARVLETFGLTGIDSVPQLVADLDAAVHARAEAENAKCKAWMDHVTVPEAYRERGSIISDTAKRGISVAQLQLGTLVQEVLEKTTVVDRSNARQDWKRINLYIICAYFVMPLTSRFRCSFVELLADAEQVPTWFVSHYWGTPFYQTLRTVALMDEKATPFHRVWCVLECYESTMSVETAGKKEHFYDIAAWIPENTQFCMGQARPEQAALQLDVGQHDSGVCEVVEKEGAFPWQVADIGVKTNVREAEASREVDKRVIMAYITGKEDRLNAIVRQRFVSGAMYSAALAGKPDALRDLLRSHPDAVDKANNKGFTPVFIAAQKGQVEALKVLVEAKANLDKARNIDATPVSIAAHKGHVEALKVLVEAKANLDKAMNDGATPVFMAALQGHVEALKVLVEAKANLDKAMNDGATPVFMAAQKGQVETLKVLVEAKANLDKARNDGATPVFMAAQQGQVEALKVLVEAKANLDKARNEGATPVFMAAKNGHVEALKVLVEAKANLDKANNNGATPVFIAEQKGQVETLKVLVEAKANVA